MNSRDQNSSWLPVSAREVADLGWEQPDVILFSGDAYVDHPSFGPAVISRYLESLGLKVALVPQPNWKDDLRDFRKLGAPRLFFGVTAGNMDSMVNHYTANKRLRSNDAYTPGGKTGFRPDYAVSVYSTILKQLFPEVPVIIGGIEASLRRLSHYDYWENKVKPTILLWSKADLLVYGMGELPIREIVRLLEKGVPFSQLLTIPQTAVLRPATEPLPLNKKWVDIELYAHQECVSDKKKYALNFKQVETESNKYEAGRLHQVCGDHRVIVNPPFMPMQEKDLDAVYALPFTRLPHPKYASKGSIPAYDMIKHSVTLHRGCFGGCSFCTISAHQGKFVVSRSSNSVTQEVSKITAMPDFKGYISDLGGASANMYKMGGRNLEICKKCIRPSCCHPGICANLNTSHEALTKLYQAVDNVKGVKKSFVSSGIRYDLFMNKRSTREELSSHHEYVRELITRHVSGRLKVAPEHTEAKVLNHARKPGFSLFKEFNRLFVEITREANLNQQLVPYFISGLPGSTEKEMAMLAIETKKLEFNLEQVQEFTPTPMTLATAVYYSGYDPYSMETVFIARSKLERDAQKQFLFWYKPEMRDGIMFTLKRNQLTSLAPELFGKRLPVKNGSAGTKRNK